jgi:hypothetical protein
MIKKFKQSDKVTRPFVVYKTWGILKYDTGSQLYNPDIPLYSCNYGTLTVGGQVEDTDNVKIVRGVRPIGRFFDSGSSMYDSGSNPINSVDGTYQTAVYNFIEKNFYSSDSYGGSFGIETSQLDWFGKPLEKRKLYDDFTMMVIPQKNFGEKIRPNSVIIQDGSNPFKTYKIKDDGNSNLILDEKYFSNDNPLLPMYRPTDTEYVPQYDRFGFSVATKGKYIAVGSPIHNDYGSLELSGSTPMTSSVWIYKYDKPTDSQRFIKYIQGPLIRNESVPDAFDSFGYSLDMTDNYLVVGSPTSPFNAMTGSAGQSYSSGFVNVYYIDKGGPDHWGHVDTISIGETGDQFGYSVSMTDDVLVIGAPGHASGSGAVYVYRRKFYGAESPCDGIPLASGSHYVFATQFEDENSGTSPLTSSFGLPYFKQGDPYWELEQRVTSPKEGIIALKVL